jgi:hypothetical protein
MKTNVFISSSSTELSMSLAHALSVELPSLNKELVPQLWRESFETGDVHIDSLLKITKRIDFAIFVLSPDDVVQMGGSKPLVTSQDTNHASIENSRSRSIIKSPRDNVVLELGLFLGSIGKDRCFVIVPDGIDRNPTTSNPENFRVLTDFYGINRQEYSSSMARDGDWEKAVRTASYKLANLMKNRKGRILNQFRALFGNYSEAVIVYPNIVAGYYQDFKMFPPLVSLETRVHGYSETSDYHSHWWFREKYSQEANDGSKIETRQIRENGQKSANIETKPPVEENWVEARTLNIAPNKVEELAHFADQRAAAAISELIAGQGVSVSTTMDGQEQDVLQWTNQLSFTVGLSSGLAYQVFHIIERETGGLIKLERDWNRDPSANTSSLDSNKQKDKAQSSKVASEGSGASNPNREDATKLGPVFRFNGYVYPAGSLKAEKDEHASIDDINGYAVIVRCFLREGSDVPPHFICGGCNASGTAAAGVYLRNHWQEILGLYEKYGEYLNTQSLAIVLQYSGGKYETSKPFIRQLCFFGPGGIKLYENKYAKSNSFPDRFKYDLEIVNEHVDTGN